MRFILPILALIVLAVPGSAQTDAGLPKDPKAQKTYADAEGWLRRQSFVAALDLFKKADKQDGGHCVACQKEIIELGEKTGDFKSAEAAAQEAIDQAST